MPATQIERPFRIKTSLGDDALLLDSFHGQERVSTPYLFVVRLLSPDPNIDMRALLTKPAVLALNINEEEERFIHGHFSRIKLQEHGDDGMAAYEAEIVPWFWFLKHFSGCRIFQNKTVPEIIEQVFRDRRLLDFQFRLMGSFPKRDYCVQYRETDFNFVSRLMEDEGIFYFFEQEQDKHTLILANDNAKFQPCPHQSHARYLVALGGQQPEDTILTLETDYRAHAGTISLTDYDFEKPHINLLTTLPGDFKGEDYDYPGKYSTRSDGERYARIRLEELEVGGVTARGESNCLGFECGYAFELTDHYRDDANLKYAIIALEHIAKNTSYRSGREDPYSYTNRFEVIPASVPFRPPRLAKKPVIPGTQTAVVVGRSGEEIDTDKYGRVKVQFHWDREGKHNEGSSCWIRVAQGWAGKLWGAMHIPRIGHEVVVSFIDGDPDRPLISGSVYNADQRVPYPLPGEQTKSTLKTLSSKGGGGFNEIRFEDKKGSEQVFVHAEKDVDLRVKNDRREWIGHDWHQIVMRDTLQRVKRDDHIQIERDRFEKIGRDRHLEVDGKEAIQVAGSHSFKVTGDVIEQFKGNHSCQVTQNIYLKGMQLVVEAAIGLTLKVGGSFITVDPSGVYVSGPMLFLNSGGAALAGAPGSLVSPQAPTDPNEADKGEPGAMGSALGQTVTPASMSLSSISANAPTHNPNDEENREKKSWIEIVLVDETENPVPGESYCITLPDGTTIASGTLDDQGFARVDHIDPGTCKVTFPRLDQEAWDRHGCAGGGGRHDDGV
jgi:type VI secretion system secreted protein VgrG